ncbi:MAG: type II toxin-antitoxin system RelE/ParE family toxin, partial [Alphaproteobacteria bacterium]|nr:type II toxin-antitoxin system RelE/ParE family toxin [Alphaproteobacteria bacterium]
FHDILRWTAERFGTSQAELYEQTLTAAIDALSSGPDPAGARRRKELPTGLLTLHVARKGRHGRHLLLLRIAGPKAIEVVRILHDSMDLVRHIQPGDE